MNIQEIERELGIPRANVRYYEKEGLLHPGRGSNNYRIYTDADVEALQKIRLLRQLDMPIETIRAVQAGEVPLAAALERQARLLESEAVKLDRSREVCRSMLADGVTYAALEPARYEQVRPALPGQAAPEPPKPKRPPVEGAEWAFDPWQRFWARWLEVSFATGIVKIVLALVFHASALTMNSTLLNILSVVFGWALILLIEPLLLSTWGTTPGKRLLGLELRSSEGGKLHYSEAAERTWGVLGTGYGFEIPFFSEYRMYRGWRTCRDGERMEYDQLPDFQYYSLVPGKWHWRAGIAAALVAALIGAEVWCCYQVLLPPHRGEITKAEFAENVNVLAKRLDYYSLWVDEDGYELADQTMSWREGDGPWVEQVYGQPISDKPVYTVETDGNGYVTAVIVEDEGGYEGDGGSAWLPIRRAELVVMAFAGTEGSGLALSRSELLAYLSEGRRWDDRAVSDNGFTLTVTLEKEGYYDVSDSFGFLMPEEGAESGWYRFTVRLEKT